MGYDNSTNPCNRVVCLCGSSRFKDLFLYIQKILEYAGFTVLRPDVFTHAGDKTNLTKEELNSQHKDKILQSEVILVIDPDGYVGESTKSEIEFAKAHSIEVKYLSEALGDK